MNLLGRLKFSSQPIPRWVIGSAALCAVGCILLTASALLTFWNMNNVKAELALLETENTARRVNAALLAPDVWKPVAGAQQKLLMARDDAPPVALWGLSRWPTGAEIFLAVRGKTPFLVRSPKPDFLEFVPTDANTLFARAVGELKNVEWFFADNVNSGETALVSMESGEARERAYKKYHWATVSVPGTNTILRRYFVFDAWGVLREPLFYSLTALLSGLSAAFWMEIKKGAVWGAVRGVGSATHPGADARTKEKSANTAAEVSGLRGAPFFIQRVLACFENDLMETQSLIILTIDSFGNNGRERVVEAISKNLGEICKHGPLPVLLQNGGTTPRAQALWGIHCPHIGKAKALSFAETCRTKLEALPELALYSPAITLSAAVAEFRKDTGATFDAEALLKNLLASTIAALQRTQELGGAQTVFAESITVENKETSL